MNPAAILQLAQLVGQLISIIVDNSEDIDPELRYKILAEIDEARDSVESAKSRELQRLRQLRLKPKRSAR